MKKTNASLLFQAIVLTFGLAMSSVVVLSEAEGAWALWILNTLLALATGATWGVWWLWRSGSKPAESHPESNEEQANEYGMGQPCFWKFAMNSIPDYFYAKDLQGRYLGQNKALLELYRHSSEACVVGKTNADLYPDMDREAIARLEEVDLRAAYSAYPLVAEESVPSMSGEIMVCESVKYAYRAPDGAAIGMICVSRNITSRKQIEAALQQSRAEAQAANKAKSAFLNTNHEIRTPLNGILGMLYLAEQTELTEKQRTYLRNAKDSASHLLGVVNDILDFSKIEAGKMTLDNVPLDLTEAFSQVVELYGLPARQAGVEVTFTADPRLPSEVRGDPMRLRQILTNLVGNAVKFTPEGSICVTCTSEEQTEDTVRIRVAVRDTGIGIGEEALGNLFKAFSQGDASKTRMYGGTGLGLVISRELAHLMGGDITVSSREGEGSIFSFTAVLGLVKREHDGPKAQVQVVQPLDKLSGQRVLLVEDNAINRMIASEMLERVGIIVEEAHNGLEALEKIHNSAYDVVLMDIQMPLMDGLTAVRTLREDPGYAHLPVIAMTAHAMRADHEESFAAGMQEHVTKPIDPQVLYETLLHWVK